MADRAGATVVVTPVYEDVVVFERLCVELAQAGLGPLFVVAVDDGSVHAPADPCAIAAAGLQGVVLRLRRNVGHQRALAVGLGYVMDQHPDVDAIVLMDSDGEDRPSSTSELLHRLRDSGADVVVAQRRSRTESLRFRMFYAVYRVVFGVLAGRRIRFGNFMALRPDAVRRLVAMEELWVHVAATVLASRLRVASCPIDRGRRYAGRSRMNFVSLALHGFRGLMVFAEDVLVRVGIACTAIAGLSVVGGVIAVTLKLMGYATPGWFSVAVGIMLLVFLQTGTLTLVSLMLTGIARKGGIERSDYTLYIDCVLRAPRGGDGDA